MKMVLTDNNHNIVRLWMMFDVYFNDRGVNVENFF